VAQAGGSPHRLAVLPALALLVAAAAYPTAYLAWLALCDWTPTSNGAVFVGLRHLKQLLTDDPFFWHAAGVTLLYTTVALAAELGLGLALALALVGMPQIGRVAAASPSRRRAIGALRAALATPMMLTPVVVGLSWRVLFDPDLGLLNEALALVGIRGPAWVAEPRTALASLVLVDVWQWTPFFVLTLSAALVGAPRAQHEAAVLDGAGAWQRLVHLALPGLRHAIASAVLLRGVDLFKAFDVIFIVTEGGPGTATETLNLYTYRVLRRFDIGYAAAIGLALLALSLVASRLFARGLDAAERGRA
jgi:multiple sugar transport system permease protein